MAASYKGSLSFGLVHIPVALYTATQDNDIKFNQLCKEDNSRIKYKKVCAHCNKEVTAEDIIKGFEYEKGKYVTLDAEDFEKAKTKKNRTINILHFADLGEIKPVYFDKTYHAVPEAGGEKAFELLRKAMYEEKKVGIAKAVIGTSEKLIAVIANDEGIMAETMFFYDEIKSIPKSVSKPELNDDELKMAKTLISSMVKPFEPQIYHDEYQARLREIIEKKIAGEEIVIETTDSSITIINLMEALKQSIENTSPKKPRRKAVTKK